MNSKLLDKAKQLVSRTDAVLEFGVVLNQARQEGEFAAFCKEVGVGVRKAYHLAALSEEVRVGKLTPDQVRFLGWAKASVIAGNTKNGFQSSRAATYARAHPLAALHRYLRGDKPEPTVTKSFHMTKDQAAEIEQALLRYGARRSGRHMENRSKALLTLVRSTVGTESES